MSRGLCKEVFFWVLPHECVVLSLPHLSKLGGSETTACCICLAMDAIQMESQEREIIRLRAFVRLTTTIMSVSFCILEVTPIPTRGQRGVDTTTDRNIHRKYAFMTSTTYLSSIFHTKQWLAVFKGKLRDHRHCPEN